MKSAEEFMRRIFGINIRRPNIRPPKDKYVVVKHNGQQKVYRVNKYGELFEHKE